MRFRTELDFTIMTTSRWRRWCRNSGLAGVPAVRVETDGEEEQGEGMALGEGEGWADEERELRCPEGAEGVCCGAGIRKKGVGEGDEILADRRSACQSVVRPGGRWLCRSLRRTFVRGWKVRDF
jgi:hypothetical protein